MSTFGTLRSSYGLYVGSFPPVTTMNAGRWDQPPELFSNSFGRFSFMEFGEPGTIDLRWDNLYKKCVVSFPSTFTIIDLALQLQTAGATTQGNATELFTIPTTLQNTDMAIMGWSDSSTTVRYAAYKRVLNPDHSYTYTSISSTQVLADNSGSDSIYAVAGKFYLGGIEFYGFGLASKMFFPRTDREQISVPLFTGTEETFVRIFGVKPDEDPYSPEFGPGAQPGGGYIPGGGGTPTNPHGTKVPTFDNTSDKIEIDPPPTLTALTSDLVHAYKVTDSELDLVAEAMYPDYVIAATDVKDALIGIWNSIFFSKYVDYLLDLMILPIDVPAPHAVYMKAGGRFLIAANSSEPGSKIASHLVTQQYVDVTCGSISIDEYWVNFLDFTGTKIKLFLPYVGFVDIQPEYVIGGTLYVDYRFNVCDGSFMCYVRSHSGYSELDESLVGQYAGVAAMHIPLQSTDYSNKVAGLISAIGTVAAGAASGGIAAAGAGASASAVNTLIQKPGSSHANGYNASSSFLSNRTPYLIIERQWAQFSEKYPEEIGVPSNVMCRIGDLSGLVKSENAHLDVIPANKEVKDMIAQLLADGIIVG